MLKKNSRLEEKEWMDAFFAHNDELAAAMAPHTPLCRNGIVSRMPFLMIAHPASIKLGIHSEIVKAATSYANEQGFEGLGIIVEEDGTYYEHQLPLSFLRTVLPYPVDATPEAAAIRAHAIWAA